jgi:hypothetical protein
LRVSQVVILALAGASLIGGVLLIPGSEEHVSILRRAGHLESALQELDRMQAAGDRRPHTLRQIADLNAETGNIEKAIGALEGYLTARPGDWSARAQLANLYLATQRTELYVSTLETSMALQPSADTLRDLLGFYRLHGRFDAEEQLLLRYLDTAYLRPRDLERAGALLAARSEFHTAAKALTLADERAPPQEESGRLLLFDVLLSSGREIEAKNRALRWISAWRKTYLATALVERFARLGYEQQALDLVRGANKYLPDMEAAATWFLVKDHARLAQRVLEIWAERLDHAEGNELRQYVAAALATGDAAGPIRLFRRLVTDKTARQAQATLAEEIARAYGLSALASLRPLLSYEALLTRPVFGAELALHEGSPLLARKLLEIADLRALTLEQRARWLALLRQVEPDAEVFEHLSELRRLQQLPGDMLPPLARIALTLGRAREHDAIWNSIGRRDN